MRKLGYSVFSAILLIWAVMMFSACNPFPDLPTVKITYYVDGEIYRYDEYDKVDFKFPPKPSNDFYTFDGWFLDSGFEHEFKSFSDIPDGATEISVFAKRTPKNYNFVFISNGKTYSTSIFTNYGDFVFPSEPDRNGFEFKGWFLKDTTPVTSENIAELCPLPARYEFYARFECLHTVLEDEITVNPTCESDGIRYVHCSNCDTDITLQILPATGHNIVIDKAIAPTCTKDGLTQGEHCSYCLTVFVPQTPIDATGHSFDGGTVTVPATCEQTGTLTFSCTREDCGHFYTEDIPSHVVGEWQTVKDGNYLEQGERIKTCTLCGIVMQKETFAGNGHSLGDIQFDEDGHRQLCSVCNEAFSSPHSLNGADCCDLCSYYLPDTPASGSVIQNPSKRNPISTDFFNIPGISDGTLIMEVIDIAQGDSIFFKFPDGQTMLMDSGSVNFPIGNHYDRVKKVLDFYNVHLLDYLFITHSDYDHVRYIEDVLKDFEVKNIYIPKLSDNSNGSTWKDTAKAISNEKYTSQSGAQMPALIRYNIGDYEISGNGWRMRCHSYLLKDYPTVSGSSAYSPTAPDADSDEIINSLSPVCLLEYAGRTIVLTGDSNRFNEEYLVNRGVFDGVDADILKVAHHGSATSSTSRFLSAVKCEYAIISFGTNIFGHPTDDVLNRLTTQGYKEIFKTKDDGNIRVCVGGDGNLSIDTAKSYDKNVNDTLTSFSPEFNLGFVIVTKRRVFAF